MGATEPAADLQQLSQEIYQATRTDSKRSLELARRAVRLALKRDRRASLGLAARGLGHAWRAGARYRRALAAYAASDRAFTLAGLPVERARNAIGKLDALMYLGRYEEALTVAADAEKVFLEAGATVRLATLQVNLGSLLFRMDRYREAAEAYARSLPIFQAAGDRDAVANIQFNLGTVHVSLLQFQHADNLFRTALPYFHAGGMRVLEAMTDYNLACLDHLRGHYADALQRLERAIAILGEDGDQGLLASCLLEQTDLFLSLGMAERAARSAGQASQRFEHLGMRYELAQSHSSRGVALALSGRAADALEVLARALSLFREEGNEHWIGLTRLHLAEIHRLAGRVREAGALAREAGRVLGARGEARGVALAELVLGSLDTEPRHRLHLGRAVRTFRRSAASGLEAEALARLARQLHRAGRRRGAFRCVRLAIERTESLRSQLSEGSLRRHFLSNRADLYARAALLTSDEPAVALGWLERGRARSLVELLEGRDFRGALGRRSSEGSPEVRSLRDELNLLYRRLDSQSWSEQRPNELARLRERIRIVEADLEDASLRQDLTALPSAPAVQVGQRDSAVHEGWLANTQDALALEFFEVDGRIGSIALRSGQSHVFPDLASRSEIRALLRQLRLGMAAELANAAVRQQADSTSMSSPRETNSLSRELTRLYDLLVRAAVSRFGLGQRLLVLPASVVSYVPFAALVGEDGKPLADRTALSLSPSLGAHRQFAALACRRLDPPRDGALVVGFGPGLPNVERETQTVARLLGPKVKLLSGAEATASAVLDHGTRADLIHLACHGVFRRDHPLFSSLVLADGRLSFYDLFQADLRCSLVVLSACETGQNEDAPGEELLGLSGGLLQAGARTVLVSLWEVCDASSAPFMELFYSFLCQGLTAASALTSAQTALRGEWAHPAYWAPYVLLGDPDVRLA